MRVETRLGRVLVTVAYLSLCLVSPSCAATAVVSTVPELRNAVQSAEDGDVIELADGVYAWSDATSLVVIQDKASLTIRSQSGNRDSVVLQGQGIDSGTQFCFKLYRSPNCTIESMTLQDVYWHCVQINEDSHHCTLRNLVMIDAGEGPVKVTSGGLSAYSDYGLIEDCHIAYTDQGTRGCVEGVDIVGAVGWVIRNCEFYRARKSDGVGWGIFAKGNSQDTVIENCYFEDCDIAISFGGGGTSPEWFRDGDSTFEHRRGIICNNVVNRTQDVAAYMNSATDFKLYNNTLWSTFSAADSSVDVRFNSSGEVFNNIGSQHYRLRDGGQATSSNNIWHAEESLFCEVTAGDFHLVATAAAAIDQGLDTSADVAYDMDREPRPWGTAVDIGADEYVAPGPFPDVSGSHWAALEIAACVVAQIVSGYPDGLYHPDIPVSRDQISVFIARALAGGDENVPDGPDTATFNDVPTDHWGFKYVEYCVITGVVQGFDPVTYGPAVAVSRDAMAVFIARAVAGDDDSVPDGPAEATFDDVPTDHWAYKYVEYCVAEEIVHGYDPVTYGPTVTVSRDQMAVFISRAFDLAT